MGEVVAMDLHRGILAKIDRRILSGIGNDERRMVRMSVAPAMWPIWRRCCIVSGLSRGRVAVGLIAHEFATIVSPERDDKCVFGAEPEGKLVAHGKEPRCSRSTPQRPGRSLRTSKQRLKTVAADQECSDHDSPPAPRSDAMRDLPAPRLRSRSAVMGCRVAAFGAAHASSLASQGLR